jgi:hypothetical protein
MTNETSNVDLGPIALIESIRSKGKTWETLAPCYGVSNADPPWKTSLAAMCDCLAVNDVLPTLDRRNAEDTLVEAVYSDVPAPERQLLALVHTMLHRGLVFEDELTTRMDIVRLRLEAV